ncbi:hypothetical protein D3C80_778910 [compost metagenome]
MSGLLICAAIYLLIGILVAVVALAYTKAMRWHDKTCHDFYFGLREASRPRRYLALALCCAYITVLWLPLVLGFPVPAIPTIIRRN